MKIAVTTESTLDMPKELLDKYDIHTVPFTVILGEKSGLDGEITPFEIFDYVEETGVLPRTACVNEYQYEEFFKSVFSEGYDAIIHISLSSQISTACANAKNVASRMKNVYIHDSLNLSTGIAIQAIFARELAEQGKEPKEIIETLEKRRSSVCTSFVVNTLDYLYKGGRCSGTAKFFGTMLRIKPQILVKADGKMVPGKKYKGKGTSVVKAYCEDTLNEFPNIDKKMVFITHSHATPEMVQVARECLEKRGCKNIIETTAGATITSHCGPKTLGLLYYKDGGKY